MRRAEKGATFVAEDDEGLVDSSGREDGFGLIVAEGRYSLLVMDESVVFHQHVGETIKMVQFHLA